MKTFFSILSILFLLFTVNVFSQSGPFDFTTVSNPLGPTPSQTVSGVTLEVSDNKGDVRVDNGGDGWGTTGNVCYSASASAPQSMTLTFTQHVYIVSLQAGELNGTSETWVFTPYNGSTAGTSYSKDINGTTGTSVTFPSANFGNIDKIIITISGGGTANFIIDDVVMNAPLPVELTSFTGAAYGSIVALDWVTATEVNNYGFEVERSVILSAAKKLNADGGTSASLSASWETLGFVQGHGNSNSPKNYSFEDKNPPVGKVQYRLKQIDFDGKFEYSPVVEVDVEAPVQLKLAQNYPNPFNPETTINYQIPFASRVTLKVFDVLGNEVATLVDEFQQAGTYNQKFNVSHSERSRGMASGVYFYKLQTDNGFSKTKKLMIIK